MKRPLVRASHVLLLCLLFAGVGLNAQSAKTVPAEEPVATVAFLTEGEDSNLYEVSYAGSTFERQLEARVNSVKYIDAVIRKYESQPEIKSVEIDSNAKIVRISVRKGMSDFNVLGTLTDFNNHIHTIKNK